MAMTEGRIVGVRGDTRSAMARISDARPFKPYVYRGNPDTPGTIAARKRAQEIALKRQRERDEALAAQLERERAAEVMPDPAPGWGWYRELKEDDELAELAAERDRYQAAMAAVPEPRKPDPPPAPPLVTAPVRCRRCKYLTTSAGHRVMCDG